MDGFHAVLIEGLFYRKDGDLAADLDGHTSVVEELLAPCEGSRVKCLVQYLPPQPPMLDRWGAGCCMWQPSGHCPAGHHVEPGKMLNFHRDGTFLREGCWKVGEHEVPLELLDGHHGRVVVISEFDSVKMVQGLEGSEGERLQTLMGQVHRIRDILSQLQGATGRT